MNDLWSNGNKFLALTIFALLSTVAGGAVVVILLLSRATSFADYAITYDHSISSVCPGFSIPYTTSLTSRHALAVVDSIDTVYDNTRGVTAIPDRSDDTNWFILMPKDKPGLKSGVFVVPELPAGSYDYRRALVEFGKDPLVVAIPFTIGKECKK